LILKYDQFVYGFNKRNEFKEELKNFFIEFWKTFCPGKKLEISEEKKVLSDLQRKHHGGVLETQRKCWH